MKNLLKKRHLVKKKALKKGTGGVYNMCYIIYTQKSHILFPKCLSLTRCLFYPKLQKVVLKKRVLTLFTVYRSFIVLSDIFVRIKLFTIFTLIINNYIKGIYKHHFFSKFFGSDAKIFKDVYESFSILRFLK